MTKYDVYVRCDHCSQNHSVHVSLQLEDDSLDGTHLMDHIAEDKFPTSIAFMRSNKYRCPHTSELYAADDIAKIVLFAAVR
ncbi:MAG TPA: hypothetical protein PLP07_15300 [Pyrinomonadaceae bacterium]|nr:hypothetical protein [Chloracidobacterium sp.]MBP9934694.1 hypothetical protein [Pyrinomonadaceae bacterium]MBK7804600.1 hypothetical protein [Chloracidobacterium sp.]MBK9439075.1 hypothetical protein [Chloracidobacterium sp.]MBK9769183.1 hypothetical protein [Chloracidobacterium sp.]